MRTDLDFSKHELKITQINGVDSIFALELPNTSWHKFVFIVTNGITAVTGDYDNWIFSREFKPSASAKVQDHYWAEKLRISSVQKSHVFDTAKTIEIINEMIAENPDFNEEEIEYLTECKNYAQGSEFEYVSYAFNNSPSHWDSECIPIGEIIEPRLAYVFDAFDEICNRLKNENI